MIKPESSNQSGDNLDDDMDLLDQDLSETDDWDDGDLSDDNQPPKKKKSGMFNIIIIGFGVLAFFGIMYFQMGAMPPAVPTSPTASPAPSVDATAPGQPEIQPPQPTSHVSTTPEPGPLTPMPEFGEATETPTAEISSNADAVMLLNVANQEGTPTPAPQNPMPGTSIVPPVVTLTPNDPAPSPVPIPLENSDKNAGDQMIQSPESMDKADPGPLSQMPDTSVPSKEAATIAALNTQIKTLNDRIAELEMRLAERTAVTPDESSSGSLSRTPVSTSTQTSEPSESSPKSDHQSGEDTAQSTEPSERPVTQPTRKVRYVLRAVSNGTAYIAPNATAGVTAVQVGTDIDGFGTVKQIRMNKSGRWQVVTTAGTITSK